MASAFEHLPADEPLGRTGLWVRRASMTLLALVAIAALLNTFGQRTTTTHASGPAATLQVSAPERVRGGLFFQSKVDIRATRTVQRPRLVLADGWLEGMQVNSIEPAPDSESSRDGLVVLSWNTLEGGDLLRVWMQFEVNPTNIGRRDYTAEFDDGDTPLARVSREITVLP